MTPPDFASAQPWDFGLLHEMVDASLQGPTLTFLEGAGDRTLTYAEILDLARGLAGTIQAAATSDGAHVAVVLDNCWEFVVALLGCSLAGAVSVPVNTAMRGQSLRHVLRQTQPRIIILAAERWPDVGAELDSVAEPPLVVFVGTVPPAADLPTTPRDDGTPSVRTAAFAELLCHPGELRPTGTTPGDPACILYTSGSTGAPKGVVCTHAMMSAWAASAQLVMGYTVGDTVFVALPLFHANALCCSLLPALGAGASLAIARSFSASAFWSQIAAARATTVNLLGVMEAILRRGARPGPHELRLALVIPPPADPGEFGDRFGVTATTLYGLTDSGIPIGVPHGAELPASRCGVTVPWWDCELVDERDNLITGPGVVGELVMRSRVPHIMMAGYLSEPAATVAAWRGLWFHTGDHMWRDEEGWYHFVGRHSDAMRRGGENVSAYEVEQVLLGHGAVTKAAVFGVASDIYGEEIMAVIQSQGFTAETLDSIVAHCRANLPYFAVPRYVRVADDLPMTASEKIAKSVLKREGVQPGTWDLGERGSRAPQPHAPQPRAVSRAPAAAEAG